MITLRSTYPANPESRFDEDYFVSKHVPLACEVLAGEFVAVRVLRPVAVNGEQPGERMVVEFDFPTREALARATASPRMAELGKDVANYSDSRASVTIMDDAAPPR